MAAAGEQGVGILAISSVTAETQWPQVMPVTA